MSWNFAYDSPAAIVALLEENGLAMNRKFGQNFLLSPHVRSRIVGALDSKPSHRLWEVGAGIGSLTDLLLQTKADVTAFEIDHGFCRILSGPAFGDEPSFHLVEGDVLKTWERVRDEEGTPDRICGNLPYNVGSMCIARLLEGQCLPPRMVFTLQLEVGRRLCAVPDTRDWSTFAILAQIDYEVDILCTIDKSSFYPAPDVVSCVVVFQKRRQPRIPEALRTVFLSVVKDVFAQRRKTLRNNLLSGTAGKKLGREGVTVLLEQSGVDSSLRAEHLGWEALQALAVAEQDLLASR